MEGTLSYLALQGSYDIGSVKAFHLLSAVNKRRNTRRAHVLRLHHCQEEPFFRVVSPQVHHSRQPHYHGICRWIKLTSLRDASVDFAIPKFGQVFWLQIEDNWGPKDSGLVLGYDQNVLIDSTFIKLQNGLLYYCQSFHCPTSVERLGLHCKAEYTNANQGIMPETHNIWVQYMDSDLDNIFHGPVPSVPILYFTWTSPNQIIQIEEQLPARNMISTVSKWCKTTQQ